LIEASWVMESARQHSCVRWSGGAAFVAGVGLIYAGVVAQNDAVMNDTRPMPFVLATGCATAVLGVTAICLGLTCLNRRAILAALVVTALVLWMVCLLTGGYALQAVVSDAGDMDAACEFAQRNSRGQPNANTPAEIQAAFDEVKSALLRCREAHPMAVSLQNCPGFTDKDAQPSSPHLPMLEWAESTFVCGGFCKPSIPVFGKPTSYVTETNKGEERPACFRDVASTLRWRGGLVSIVAFMATPALLSTAFAACWLCCAPPPRRRDKYGQDPALLSSDESDQDEDTNEMEMQVAGPSSVREFRW